MFPIKNPTQAEYFQADHGHETPGKYQNEDCNIPVKVINHLGDEVMKVFAVNQDCIHEKNQWYIIKNQSLAVYARNAGFDLAVYEDYLESVREELKKRTIKAALAEIRAACDEKGLDIATIKQGIYVISLSNPL